MDNNKLYAEAISILRETVEYSDEEKNDLLFKIAQVNPEVLISAFYKLSNQDLSKTDIIVLNFIKEGRTKCECIKLDRELTGRTVIESKANVEKLWEFLNMKVN